MIYFIQFMLLFSIVYCQGWHNHPELEWQSFETDHFVIYFHKETERSALEASKVAELISSSVTVKSKQSPSVSPPL